MKTIYFIISYIKEKKKEKKAKTFYDGISNKMQLCTSYNLFTFSILCFSGLFLFFIFCFWRGSIFTLLFIISLAVNKDG